MKFFRSRASASNFSAVAYSARPPPISIENQIEHDSVFKTPFAIARLSYNCNLEYTGATSLVSTIKHYKKNDK